MACASWGAGETRSPLQPASRGSCSARSLVRLVAVAVAEVDRYAVHKVRHADVEVLAYRVRGASMVCALARINSAHEQSLPGGLVCCDCDTPAVYPTAVNWRRIYNLKH